MLEVLNVRKAFKKNNRIVLNDISLKVNKGEVIGLLGPNGAGKTTLIKILNKLILPDSGEIKFDGTNINKLQRFKYMSEINVVLEGSRNLYWRVSTKDNFYYLGALKGKKKSEIKENISKYIDVLKIQNLIHRKVGTLSLGEKQRVAITNAFLTEPSIIFLDEPSNGLDIDSKSYLINGLNKLKKINNCSILITSHDLDFLSRVVDRFVFINRGKIASKIDNNSLKIQDIENHYHSIINKKSEESFK